MGSYLFIEKPELDRYRKKTLNERPFLSFDIKSIIIHAGRLDLNNGKWVLQNSPEIKVDQLEVKKFIGRLKKLKIIKVVDVSQFPLSWDEFSLIVKNTKVKVFVGEKQQFSERYYLKIKNAGKVVHYLVEDSSPQIEAIPDEVFKVNPLKRLKIISFINKTKLQLVDTNIYIDESQNISIQRRLGKKYTINLSEKKVQYAVGKNFLSNKQNIRDWKNGLTKIRPLKLLKDVIKNDLRELGIISGIGKNGEGELNVYLDPGGGVIAKDNLESFYRQYEDEQLKFLLPNYQDFILKNILGKDSHQDIQVIINDKYDQKKKLLGQIKNDQFYITSKVLEKKQLKLYGRVIESLFAEADYVNWGREMTINPEKKIDLQINSRKLTIGQAHGMIEIFDKIQKVSYFYRDQNLYENLEKL